MSSSQETEEDEGGVESSPQSEQSAASPAPSSLSMKSDQSMDQPIHFRYRALDGKFSPQSEQSAASPPPSSLSMKSDQSMDQPINFRYRALDGKFRAKQRKMSAFTSYSHSSWRGITDHPGTFYGRPYHCPQSEQSAASPAPSSLSMKSDQSMDQPINFRYRALDGKFRAKQRKMSAFTSYSHSSWRGITDHPGTFYGRPYHCPQSEQSAASPAPSYLSMKSDQSMDQPIHFRYRALDGKFSPQSEQSAASPAPSSLSMKSDQSMDQPINFRYRALDGKFRAKQRKMSAFTSYSHSSWRGITDHPGTFYGRPYHCPQSEQSAASPAPSSLSMKSDQSMDQPINFRYRALDGKFRAKQRKMSAFTSYSHSSWRGITDHPGTFYGRPYHWAQSEQSAASPAPSYLSMKSDQSMDQPIHFRYRALDGKFSALTASLLAEDHFRCSVCKEVLNEPVSIPCGHSFCRQCIETCWNNPVKKKVYDCPGCQRRYITCPVLFTNLTLDKVIQKLQQTGFKVPALPPHRYAGPGDVACDLCTEKQLRAVKFCLTCTASYCESHVRQHYTVAALQRHTLVDVTGNLDQKLCNEEQQTALRLEAKLEQMNTEFAEEKTQKNKLTQNVKNPTTELTCYAKRSSKDWATECFVLAALGRPLDLGMMYDCCSDCLSSDVGLWDESTTANMRQSLPRPHTEVMCIERDSLQDRFRALDVSTSLRAGVLSGLVEVGGAAGYLNHPAQSKNKDRVTLQYRTTTRLDMLSRRVFEETVKRDSKATHVVMAVLYGAQAFFIFDDKRVSGEKRAGGGEVDMRSVIKKMVPSFSADHMLSSLSDNEKINSLLYQCTLHSDVDHINGSMTYGQAVQALETLPKHLGQQGEKAVPLYAWLYPLKNLDTSVQITQGFLSEAEDVVEHLRQVTMRCQDMMTLLHVNDDVMKWFPSVKEKLAEFSELLQKYQSEFKRGLAMAVKTVRESEEMDEKRLRDILQNHDQSPFCSQYTHQWLNNKEEEIKALLICKEKNIPIGKEVQEKAKNIHPHREGGADPKQDAVLHAHLTGW
ncbi:uncharacterized protein isoform X3 [Salmo salar]|uniref:Uncharacterized protein isoform X3 n=1 Tax=Salmo salar TaxID=8030 RepID=A0ABM3CXT1_SALSA|nr:uncharacterized protein LOC106570908 isoform X3 [Salmo salar]